MARLTGMLKDFLKQIRTFFQKARSIVLAWLNGFRLQPGWERGAALAVGVLVLLTAGYYASAYPLGLGRAGDTLLALLVVSLGGALAYWLAKVLMGWLFRLPVGFWAVLIVGGIAGYELWGERTWQHWVFNLGLVAVFALLGTSLYALVRGEWQNALLRKRIFLSAAGVLGFGALAWFGVVFFSPGRSAVELPVDVTLGEAQLNAENPGEPGPYPVAYLTYGSGKDLRREEYGEGAALITNPVNGSGYVSFSGISERLHEFYWGFTTSHLPLNGRVWYPQGEGPFPLVLIVHGNHSLVDFSDGGYDYLGELLASRGFIAVSVDENFLNGGTWVDAGGENDARAWLLLKHLEVWEGWNEDAESPFYGTVDMDQIALVGHSRGGEAAALAATFNRLSRNPNNAKITWNFNFNIRSVVAIAPVDEQWRPADQPNPLTDVSYLVLQGSHDADLYYFDGIQQYNRASFTRPTLEAFKASVYIYRANHGQFNTSWGNRDSTGVKGQFLNRAALLTAEEQEQIAKVYISAFLEATLKGEDVYRDLFIDYRLAGNWLPQTNYITQYEDIGIEWTADFEEDVDVLTCSLPGCEIRAAGLTTWNESAPRFRNKDRQENHVVRLGWSGAQSYFAVKFSSSLSQSFTPETLLVFKAADARKPEDLTEGLDISVVLVDQWGNQASLTLSEVLPLQTQFPAEISRLPLWNESYFKEAGEEVFQTYRIPLAQFTAKTPGLDLDGIREIRFQFDQTPSGLVYLDEIGFDLVP